MQAPVDLVPNSVQNWVTRNRYTPPRQPDNTSDRPNPRFKILDEQPLHVMLGEEIGFGDSGVVFEALVIDERARERLPALVAKVARYKQRGRMAREKWLYDELWPLQGVAIPHCYGWFETEVDPSADVWGQNLKVTLSDSSWDPLSPLPLSSIPDTEPNVPTPPQPWSNDLDDIAAVTDRISILLIERAGDSVLQGQERDMPRDILYGLFFALKFPQ